MVLRHPNLHIPGDDDGHEPRPLTPEEIKQTAENLRRLPRGFLPLEVFNSIAELVATPTIDVAPLRERDGRLEVFMLPRPDDDPYWAGQWHMPGTVLRSTDNEGDFSSGFERLFAKKGEGEGKIVPVTEPKHIGTKFWNVERGRELDHMHYVVVETTGDDVDLPGVFFPVDELPDNTIEHHKVMIGEIVEAYRRDTQGKAE